MFFHETAPRDSLMCDSAKWEDIDELADSTVNNYHRKYITHNAIFSVNNNVGCRRGKRHRAHTHTNTHTWL